MLILSIFSINFWERGDEISNYNCEFIFPVGLSVFASYIFQLCLVHVLWDCSVLVHWSFFRIICFSSLVIFFCSEMYFIWYLYSYSCFHLINVCMIYLFTSFYIELGVSLYLKWVCCRKHMVESCFLIYSVFSWYI